MEKLKIFKNNLKEKLKKIKNYIIEIFNKNIFTIHFILNLVLTMLLICSLIMTKNVYKRLDNISHQVNSITADKTSQNSVETDTDVSSEVESEPEKTVETEPKVEPTVTEPTKPTVTPTPTPSTTSPISTESTTVTPNTTSDLDMLACVIYQEAGGNRSCDDCRRRVADVVLNRVADSRFPNTIKDVLTSKNQYGRFYYTGVVWPSRAKNTNEQAAVARAYRIAEEVLNGQHSELHGNGYIWQAGFRQGSSQVYCCGIYFGK